MRVSIALYCGAAAVSALTLPPSITKRVEHVDLAQFGHMNKITLEEAKANVAKNNAAHQSRTVDARAEAEVNVSRRAGTCTAPETRIEWRSLSAADQASFVAAIKCLIDLPPSGAFASSQSANRYEDLVAVHLQMSGTIHGVAQFLPWHRYYVSVFESMLREECSYTGPMTWWNEDLDAGNFANAPMFTSAYYGTAALVTSAGQGTCVTDGVSVSLGF
jgi:tyrosinase